MYIYAWTYNYKINPFFFDPKFDPDRKILKDLMGILAFGVGLSAGILMLMSGPQGIILGLFIASVLFEYTYSCYCEYIDKELINEGKAVKPEGIKSFSRHFLDYHLSLFKKRDVESDKRKIDLKQQPV